MRQGRPASSASMVVSSRAQGSYGAIKSWLALRLGQTGKAKQPNFFRTAPAPATQLHSLRDGLCACEGRRLASPVQGSKPKTQSIHHTRTPSTIVILTLARSMNHECWRAQQFCKTICHLLTLRDTPSTCPSPLCQPICCITTLPAQISQDSHRPGVAKPSLTYRCLEIVCNLLHII